MRNRAGWITSSNLSYKAVNDLLIIPWILASTECLAPIRDHSCHKAGPVAAYLMTITAFLGAASICCEQSPHASHQT